MYWSQCLAEFCFCLATIPKNCLQMTKFENVCIWLNWLTHWQDQLLSHLKTTLIVDLVHLGSNTMKPLCHTSPNRTADTALVSSSCTHQLNPISPKWLLSLMFSQTTKVSHCYKKGPYWDLFGYLGPYLHFRVPIFSVLASFTRRISIQSACIQQWVNLIGL